MGRGREPLPPFVSMRPKLENDVPRFVEQSHGQFAGWLGRAFDPLTIDADPSRPDYRVGDFELQPGISIERLDDRRLLLGSLDEQRRRQEDAGAAVMDRHYHRAFELLNSAVGAQAFDVSLEPDDVRDRYGRNPHGQSVLQARRLIERGVPLVTVFWPNDGIKNVSVYWDTHSRNFVDLRQRLMPVADQAFTALLDDLSQRGLLDETLVVWTGEFGRTPKVGQRNSDAGAGRDGRDHWPNCFTTVLAGGGVPGGQVYGASDRHAAYPAASPVQPVDLMATVHHLLGIPPHFALADSQGRPQVLCPGQPVLALL
jgi:arylsulfatase A-like enzyme